MSAAEIAHRAALIQAEWTDEERQQRTVGLPGPWEVPVVSVCDRV